MPPEIRCAKCGAMNPPEGRFCNICGSPLSPPPSQQAPPNPQFGGWQPPNQPPPGGWTPPGQPPYPPQPFPGQGGPYPPQQAQSNKAIIALILGILGLVMCGPFTAVPGIFVAKSELDAIKNRQVPANNETLAKVAFWICIAVTALSVIGLCAFFGLGGLSMIGGMNSF